MRLRLRRDGRRYRRPWQSRPRLEACGNRGQTARGAPSRCISGWHHVLVHAEVLLKRGRVWEGGPPRRSSSLRLYGSLRGTLAQALRGTCDLAPRSPGASGRGVRPSARAT